MTALLDYRYWLNPGPIPFGPSLVTSLLVFFGWFLVLAIGLYFTAAWLRKKDDLLAGILSRAAGILLSTGILGWLCLFFSYEQIPVFSMRFWFLLVAVYFFFRLAKLVVIAVRDYPVRKAEREEREAWEKYLPHRS